MSDKERSAAIQELLRQSRWSDAVPLLEGWTNRFPNHAPGWFWLANCLERLGRLEEALVSARRSLALAPTETRVEVLIRRLEAGLDGEMTAVETAADTAPPAAGAPSAADEEPDSTLVDSQQPPTDGDGDETLVEGASGVSLGDSTLVDPSAAPGAVEATWAEEADATAAGAEVATGGPSVGEASVTLREERAPPPSRPSPRPDQQWTKGAVVEGRYQVRGRARGGMGEVIFVHDRELGLDIAVKTPLPAALATEAGRIRFLREAEAWIALGLHPNICAAYYVREIGGLPRLFIEYLDGGTLDGWLKAHPEAPIADRLDLAIQIASGMHHAHSFVWHDEGGDEHRGVVHRDLKPANVLLGSDQSARVTDFGLVGRGAVAAGASAAAAATEGACVDDDAVEMTLVDGDAGAAGASSIWGTMTVGGKAMGTPPYMAPEQWQGAHAAGPPADIYAFGCVLYELLCNRRPFILDSKYLEAEPEVIRRTWEHLHRVQQAPDPRDLNPGLDTTLAELLQTCLAKDTGQRPSSFAVLGGVLRDIYARLCHTPYPRPEPAASELLADSLNNRGVSFASLGQMMRAERAWREALVADPQHVQASFNLALLEWRHRGASDHDLVNRVEGARGGRGGGWRQDLLAGKTYLCLGWYPEAVDRLRSAAAAADNAPEATRERTLAVTARANTSDDAEPWQEILALDDAGDGWIGSDAAMLTCKAVAARRLGRDDDSARLWARARQYLVAPPKELQQGADRLIPGSQLVWGPRAAAERTYSVAVSMDGRVGLTGGNAGRIGVWDLVRGQLVRHMKGPGDRVRAVAVTPDRGFALSSSGTEPVSVWDVTTGAHLRGLQVHTGYLNALAISGDGRAAAGVGSAGSLIVWDLGTGKRRLALKAHTGFADCVALSADAATAVTGGSDGTVCVFDLVGERCVATLQAHEGRVTALALAGDARVLSSAGEDSVVRVWDLDTRACVETLKGHTDAVSFVAIDADGRRLLTAAADGSLRHWDEGGARMLKAERVEGGVQAGGASRAWESVLIAHGGGVNQFRCTETPLYEPAWAVSFLVTASEAEERAHQFRTHMETVRRLTKQRDFESAFATIEQARSVAGYERARDALEMSSRITSIYPNKGLRGAWEERLVQGHGPAVTAAALGPIGQRVLTATRDRRMVLWDWDRGEAVAEGEGPAVVLAVSFLANDRTAVTADLDNAVRLWDLQTWACSLQLAGHDARVQALAVDPLGHCVLTASADQTARVWDPSSGACQHVLRGHLGAVQAAAVAPDARYGATGGDDGSVIVWDLEAGNSVGELSGHVAAVEHLEWSSDGRFVLSAARDGTVRLWDVRSGRCVRTISDGLSDPVRVALSPDGRCALVGEASGRLGVWNVRERRCLQVLEGHTGAVSVALFSRSGRRALSAAADGSVRLWYLDWEPQIRPFAEWDETARPHLEVFLSQHTPRSVRGSPPPEWNDHDFRRLLSDLRHRGLGWLRPDGVRERLQELAAGWTGVPRPTPGVAAGGPLAQRGTPHSRQRWRARRRQALVALPIVVSLLLGGSFLLSRQHLRLDGRHVKERRDRDLTALVGPAYMARAADCDPALLEVYLRDFIEFTDRPGDWITANYCLAALGDPRVVTPLLDMLRPDEPPSPRDDLQIGSDPRQIMSQVRRAMTGGFGTRGTVQSVLARVGDAAVPELSEALEDSDPTVRHAAARALALRASEQSIEALVEAARHSRSDIRVSISSQLPSLACSRQLEVEEAFRLAEDFAADAEPDVRLNAVRGLVVFAGSKPRALLDELVNDPDPRVRAEAAELLE